MASTIHQNDTHTMSTGGRLVDYCQNGNLWYVHRSSGSTISFYYSTDGGVTWNLASTTVNDGVSTGGALGQSVAFFIDKDDYAHLLYYGTNVVDYRRGTPNAGRTNYTWSSGVQVFTSGTGVTYGGLDVVAHREGTGWVAHCVWLENQPGDGHGWSRVATIPINSGGTIGAKITYGIILQWGYNVGAFHSMDFRHTADDPKAVQASSPDLYIALTTNDNNNSLLFVKMDYSGGSWSQHGGAGTSYGLNDGNAVASTLVSPQLYYDGTRVVCAFTETSIPSIVRVNEFNVTTLTNTERDPTALAETSVLQLGLGYDNDQNIHVFAQANLSFDFKRIRYNRSGAAWAGSWTVVEASAGINNDFSSSVQRGIQPAATGFNQLGVVYVNVDATPDNIRFATITVANVLEANLQGVATVPTAEVNFQAGIEAALQGVATISLELQLRAGAEVLMQGVARISSEIEGVPFHDFTVYDAYLESAIRSEGLLFFDEQKPETVSRKLTPTRQDVGNNPEEVRPEFGDMFAQGDFSHGAGQRYFHQEGRDPKKYWHSEGFDISEPGKLTHLRAIAEARDSANIGRIEQVADLPFVINGQRVDRGDGNWPGTWTAEDPSAADADQNVMDICAEGARLYAALNVSPSSVRIRSSGGVWTHFQPDGATDLVVGTATRLAWLKSRLMVVGGTLGRSIYEVAAISTPVAIETLPEGWTFVDLFEAGAFIHATAVNISAGLSRVHHYGLNTAGSAIEKKSSTPFPQGQIINAGCGFPGLAFIAGGVRNSAGGYDPILYRAAVGQELGELQYEEIRQEEGAGAADLSVRAIIPMGETILTGWSLGAGAYGGARDGIAVYHIARNAFAHQPSQDGQRWGAAGRRHHAVQGTGAHLHHRRRPVLRGSRDVHDLGRAAHIGRRLEQRRPQGLGSDRDLTRRAGGRPFVRRGVHDRDVRDRNVESGVHVGRRRCHAGGRAAVQRQGPPVRAADHLDRDRPGNPGVPRLQRPVPALAGVAGVPTHTVHPAARQGPQGRGRAVRVQRPDRHARVPAGQHLQRRQLLRVQRLVDRVARGRVHGGAGAAVLRSDPRRSSQGCIRGAPTDDRDEVTE